MDMMDMDLDFTLPLDLDLDLENLIEVICVYVILSLVRTPIFKMEDKMVHG